MVMWIIVLQRTFHIWQQFFSTADLYSITSAPEPYLLNETYLVPVGNVVGGGSIINGMVYDRGSAADYDAWKELGNVGWGWAGLQPYFKKSNHYTAPSESTMKEFNISYDESAYGDGPVQVSIPSYLYPDYKTIFDSFYAENVSFPADPMALLERVGVGQRNPDAQALAGADVLHRECIVKSKMALILSESRQR